MPTVTPLSERRLLTVKQAAEYAGMSRSTLYDEAKAGRLQMVKLGAATRIERAAIDAWINAKIAA